MIQCFCQECAQMALFELGICALEPREFVARARRYKLTVEQEAIVDRMKLQMWNESAKGEKA